MSSSFRKSCVALTEASHASTTSEYSDSRMLSTLYCMIIQLLIVIAGLAFLFSNLPLCFVFGDAKQAAGSGLRTDGDLVFDQLHIVDTAGDVFSSAFFSGADGEQTIHLNAWQLMNSVHTSAILSGIALRYLYLQQQLRNQQQAELQARIQALQSRIRPHFLFNSMNSIASLIGSDPDLAERVIEDLAELFRASLAEPTLIPIDREITLCRRYLEIEQLRMGKRLSVEWQVGELSDAIKIPSLMLQPLVENAIFHGVEPMPHGGTVSIKISQAKNQLMIVITNPYPLVKKTPPQVVEELYLRSLSRRPTAVGAGAPATARPSAPWKRCSNPRSRSTRPSPTTSATSRTGR